MPFVLWINVSALLFGICKTFSPELHNKNTGKGFHCWDSEEHLLLALSHHSKWVNLERFFESSQLGCDQIIGSQSFYW